MAARPNPTDSGSPPGRLAFGPFVLDRVAAQLWRQGQPVALAPQSLALLEYLAARPGVLVSKDELLDQVWGHRFVSESALKVAINSLRAALGEDAREARWVHTVPRRGYRFTSQVLTLAAGSPMAEPLAQPAGQPVGADAGSDRHVAADGAAQVPMGAAPAAPAAGPPRPAGNLPAVGLPLLGRDDDQARIHLALAQHRLVTLTGPGGVGKTRLALASAAHQAPADGVWLLRLDAMTSEDPIGPAVARLLGLPDAAGSDAEGLARSLAPLRVRLVLDNAEHLAEPLARQLAVWLQQAPGLSVLVTSQRPLHLAPEQVLPLAPLAVPDAGTHLAAIRHSPAVALLCSRVQAAQPGWAPADDEWHGLAEIARGLDGMPLALELAAARVPLLGVAGVQQRLGERLRMLTRGAADAPQRHRTLRAALEWSVGLLPPRAAELLELCAVFVGGFTLEALQAVAAQMLPELDEWGLIDHLELLREMALMADAGTPATPLAPERGSPQARFITLDWAATPRLRVYDSVRLLGLERLAARGAAGPARQAHIDWLRGLLNHAERLQLQLSEAVWLGKVEPEIGNLTEAMAQALEAARQAPPAAQPDAMARLVDLFTASTPLVMRCGLRPYTQTWWQAVQALLQPPAPAAPPELPPLLAARLHTTRAALATQGMVGVADGVASIQHAAPVLRAHGEQTRLALALYMGTLMQLADADEAAAARRLDELRALLGPQPTVYERRLVPWAEAYLARRRGDLDTYARFFADMLAECTLRGDRIEGWKAGWGLAQALFLTGQVDAAIGQFDRTLDDLRQAGRLRANPLLAGQAAAIGLSRDALPDALARAREAVAVLRPLRQIAYSMGDALPWPAWRQGRVQDALRLLAWSDETARQRSEQRGPINARIRQALLAEFGGMAVPAESGLDDDAAVQLALDPAGAFAWA